jgi:hypothetical protein
LSVQSPGTDNPECWRLRAEESRSLADSIGDLALKRIMLGIAQDYDRMTDRAEHLKATKGGGRKQRPPTEAARAKLP